MCEFRLYNRYSKAAFFSLDCLCALEKESVQDIHAGGFGMGLCI